MITRQGRLLFLLIWLISTSSTLMAAGNTVFINEIPDFTQSHITDWRYGYGAELCAPVAVSNSLTWMMHAGSDQVELVKLLASTRYMNTDVWKGTTTTDLLNGVHAIAMDLMGGYRRLEYQGWKQHPVQYSSGKSVPDIQWIANGVGKDSAVWLNVGWYRYDKKSNSYYRAGGHWVTLVGFDSNALIIHDPAPRAGQSFANEYVHTAMIEHGTLAGKLPGLPRSARGYLLLGRGMHVKQGADLAILDGAVRFIR